MRWQGKKAGEGVSAQGLRGLRARGQQPLPPHIVAPHLPASQPAYCPSPDNRGVPPAPKDSPAVKAPACRFSADQPLLEAADQLAHPAGSLRRAPCCPLPSPLLLTPHLYVVLQTAEGERGGQPFSRRHGSHQAQSGPAERTAGASKPRGRATCPRSIPIAGPSFAMVAVRRLSVGKAGGVPASQEEQRGRSDLRPSFNAEEPSKKRTCVLYCRDSSSMIQTPQPPIRASVLPLPIISGPP